VLVLALLLLAAGLGLFAVWFQWGQTRRCLAFFGAEAARSIQSAPRVELWSLTADGERIRATRRRDVSEAAGLVHLRRGLVEDFNFDWPAGDQTAGGRSRGALPPAAWDAALAFSDGRGAPPAVIVVFDFDGDRDGGGAMTVVGRPGRVPLGRIGPGLKRWIEATEPGFSRQKSGF